MTPEQEIDRLVAARTGPGRPMVPRTNEARYVIVDRDGADHALLAEVVAEHRPDKVQRADPFRAWVLEVANYAHADDCDSDPCSCLVGTARELADRHGHLDEDGYVRDVDYPRVAFFAGFDAGHTAGYNQAGSDEGYPNTPESKTAEQAFEEWHRSDSPPTPTAKGPQR